MNKKVLTLILVIVTATSTNAMAQNIKKWSLRQCIDYAMDNYIQLQKSKISENVAETELTVLLPQTAAIKPYKMEATA